MTRPFALRAALAAFIVAVALSAACAPSIRTVLSDPSRYRDSDVQLSGHVADSYSIAGRGAYLLEDRSGSLWVVSSHGVPRNGAHVKTTGRIREAYNFGSLGGMFRLPSGAVVLVEDEHRVRW